MKGVIISHIPVALHPRLRAPRYSFDACTSSLVPCVWFWNHVLAGVTKPGPEILQINGAVMQANLKYSITAGCTLISLNFAGAML